LQAATMIEKIINGVFSKFEASNSWEFYVDLLERQLVPQITPFFSLVFWTKTHGLYEFSRENVPKLLVHNYVLHEWKLPLWLMILESYKNFGANNNNNDDDDDDDNNNNNNSNDKFSI
jgi:hypothetical protein